MPVDIHFDADRNLIVATWTNPTTLSDFAEAFRVAESAYKQAVAPVHTIYVATGLTRLPANAISIYLRHPNSPLCHVLAGYFIVVANNAFIRAIVETAGKLARNRNVYVATSLEHAQEMIERMSANANEANLNR